jgi:hypothetical protein
MALLIISRVKNKKYKVNSQFHFSKFLITVFLLSSNSKWTVLVRESLFSLQWNFVSFLKFVRRMSLVFRRSFQRNHLWNLWVSQSLSHLRSFLQSQHTISSSYYSLESSNQDWSSVDVKVRVETIQYRYYRAQHESN